MGSIHRGGGFDPSPPTVPGVMTVAATDAPPPVPCDYFDGVFDYIKQMLMEDDDDDDDRRPCMTFYDYSALQACEKYFYDALSDTAPSAVHNSCGSNRRKTHGREEQSEEDGRSSKQFAITIAENSTEEQDRALFCEKMNPGFYDDTPVLESSGDELDKKYQKLPVVKRGRPKGTTKKKPTTKAKETVVDLQTLLTRCAEAVSSFNHAEAQDLLMKIRQHSSAYGDANERLAHYFANAFDARISGTGPVMYSAFVSRRIPASEMLHAYKTYVTACPFKRMSNIVANKTIARHTRAADKIHIVDFGISYGFQWPCIIQGVSLRPGGPPKLRITGIDYPQPGFKPAERIEETGRRLASYCRRFNVPFEYNAVAKKWEDITLDDLHLAGDEMVVANCLYRLRHVADESAGVDSPRDAVLNLIGRLRPAIFVHGVVNGTYGGAAFFPTRFREALYQYASLFDVLETTLPREDGDRAVYEREVLGRDVMNVIACEGSERVDRPEGYKQWQVRNGRAGFRQVAVEREVLEEVKIKVRKGYQGEFMVEEVGGWVLQGWKGRPLYALSCWKLLDA